VSVTGLGDRIGQFQQANLRPGERFASRKQDPSTDLDAGVRRAGRDRKEATKNSRKEEAACHRRSSMGLSENAQFYPVSEDGSVSPAAAGVNKANIGSAVVGAGVEDADESVSGACDMQHVVQQFSSSTSHSPRSHTAGRIGPLIFGEHHDRILSNVVAELRTESRSGDPGH
jgi:hypothetical protein